MKFFEGMEVRSLYPRDGGAIGVIDHIDERLKGHERLLKDGRIVRGPLLWVRFGSTRWSVPRWANELEAILEENPDD